MAEWMGRTALELVGQAGLGYSFDPLVSDRADAFGDALKSFSYVLFSPSSYYLHLRAHRVWVLDN